MDIEIDVEHSRILEQLPMIAMLAFFALMALPIIPDEIKSPVMLIGLFGIFVFMFAVGPIAQYVASQYIPIKARIRPWNTEKTFFCKKPAGMLSSKYDEKRGIYITPFDLGLKTTLPKIGKIDAIELEHKRPFDERNVGTEVYVMFMGQEVKVARGILAELWLTTLDYVKIDHMKRIVRFELAVGGEDYWIAMKNRKDGNVGNYEIDLRDYS